MRKNAIAHAPAIAQKAGTNALGRTKQAKPMKSIHQMPTWNAPNKNIANSENESGSQA